MQDGLDATHMSTLQSGGSLPPASPAFGWSLSAGDINGDGKTDLAIGAPYDATDKGHSTGGVDIAYGQSTHFGKTISHTQRFSPNTSGVPGTTHTFAKDMPDSFGWQVVLADFNSDGKADLAVSAPGTPVTVSGTKHEDAGTITILPSNGSSITTTGAKLVGQSTAGMPGSPGKSDLLGFTMTAGDSNGDGKADLVMFSPGDHYVTIANGATGGPSFGTAVAWTQNSSGIPGTDEKDDRWGDSLRFLSIKGTGPQALAVGADGENNDAGSVTMVYGSTSGLTGTGSVAITQNTSGVPGTSEPGDLFGSFFSS